MSDDKNLNLEEKASEAIVELQEDKALSQPTEDYSPEQVDIDLDIDQNVGSAHDDFDWTIGNRHTLSYTEDEIKSYLSDYEQSLNQVSEYEIVSAKVGAITGGDVVLDINYKSDGLISLSEFRDMPELAVGDMVDVYVENQEDDRGQLVLSRRKAKLLAAWDMLVDSYKNGTIIKGTVVSKTKGGLIVDSSGLETFLPGSQIDIKPIIDYDTYVGKTMEFKVVKINEAIKNAVVSHKALIESDLAEQRETIIAGLEKGQVLEGLVKNITDFGAFMDLGGVDGLLYITDISWGRINHPNEILELNQKLNVVVLDFDENKKRISLGLKQLQPHPWDTLGAEIVASSVVKGKIVNIEDYGAFLEITPGVEGLIHVSEVTWSNHPVNAREFFNLGQEFDAKVVTIDREERKMSLSVKQLSEDPWSTIQTKFPHESHHKGEVKNLTPYGVFVELEEGIGGMIHISDLSWTKRYSHPSEFTKVGETLDVTIMDIDKESRKLSLGHKQLEENPWDTFENVFPVGSYHEATIIKKDDRGAIVLLPYGLEAFAPAKHLRKDDKSYGGEEEALTFKVIEFNRDDKRIIVSHTRYLDDIRREADNTVRKNEDARKAQVRKDVSKHKPKIEKTTLGELDAFSQLKTQLKDAKAAAPAVVPTSSSLAEKLDEAPAEKEADIKVADAPAENAADTKVADAPAVVEEKVEEAAPVVTEKVEEVKAEEAKQEESKEDKVEEKNNDSSAATGSTDDLKKIEGIGPKISEILTTAGIATFDALSKADPEKIREILLAAGNRYRMHDPATWPQQAGLAAKGAWDELKTLQDNLDGGKA